MSQSMISFVLFVLFFSSFFITSLFNLGQAGNWLGEANFGKGEPKATFFQSLSLSLPNDVLTT